MLEESIPAVWASLNSWFTPTLLFVFLNVMIGTIAVASGFGTNQKQTQDPNNNNQQPHQQLVRSPSVLQRIRSINLYRYRSQDLTPFSSITTTTHPPPQAEQSFQHVLDSFHEQKAFDNLENLQSHNSIDDDFVSEESETETETETETPTTFHNMDEDHHVARTLSDTKPASGSMPVKLSKKLKKSASAKSAFSHFEEQEMVNLQVRPSTVKEGKKKELQSFGDDEEVDAKADDFINKFKQQLKLQRLDSILRYKEMLGRGAHPENK
ncbi:hypothetical protein AQUCO_00100062v1 [Aquilegia coerulea]|uniref:DUF4408 domain-containing protein n=1 Tax=Aquilegia coerulea TaxID=218851 RepID=A0A2G5F8Q0_AQUCA|nr:hypothetical protein AQUCO_00100062v1 [Aquilegia coerulea]